MPEGMTYSHIDKTPLRQYYHFGTYNDGVDTYFEVSSANITHSLGNNNGFGGQVLTLIGTDAYPTVLFQGFSSDSTITLDHYAGKYVNGHLVEDQTRAYFHIHDPANPANDGYFLSVNQSSYPVNPHAYDHAFM